MQNEMINMILYESFVHAYKGGPIYKQNCRPVATVTVKCFTENILGRKRCYREGSFAILMSGEALN